MEANRNCRRVTNRGAEAEDERVNDREVPVVSRVCPDSPRNLNSSNRPVRTRMSGGVAGDSRDYLEPLCQLSQSVTWSDCPG